MSDHNFEEEEFESEFNGKTLRRIVGLTKPHMKMLIGFLGSIVVVSVLDSVFTYLSKMIVDDGIIAGQMSVLTRVMIMYSTLTVLQAVSVFFFVYLTGKMGQRIRYDLTQRMFVHLQALSLSYYSRTPVGWIMSRVTSDSGRVSDLVTWGFLDVTWAAINIVTSMTFMLILNWKLAILVFLSLPVLLWISVEFRKRILKQFRLVRKFNSQITGAYNENITGVKVVKALNREEANLGEFEVLSDNMYQAGYRASWLSALFLPSVQIISAVVTGLVIWFSGRGADLATATNGNNLLIAGMTIGSIQAFVAYITNMMWPIQDLARVYAEMQRSIASAERIFSLIDSVPEVADQPNAVVPESIQGEIEFKNVSFYYEDEKPVLTDFSLKVKPGEVIALVGPTGGGKSTIVNLMCRFYEPKQGNITINGVDYTNLSLQSIQSHIGVVPQTPHLFSGTIRENIAYGKLNAAQDEIETAARTVGAHDFITKFPKGYDEPVGEGGSLLSVGQKQLISLARAILSNPEIFVMDEATSSVDTLTEMIIQQAMEVLMEGRTSFIIAHRLSTIKRADRILVIDGGHIAEMGSHAELIRLKGKYYALYTNQFRQQIEKQYDLYPSASES